MFILCKGRIAKKPFVIPFSGQKIYSLEELCYYIYNNIYSISEELFKEPLAIWLMQECGQDILAKKLKGMQSGSVKLKDLAVTVLCACDYYNEPEIRQLVEVMDGIENLPLYKKKKIKGDNYLRAGRYGKSLLEYRKLLHGSFAVNFTTEEYGDILHNQGIAHFYTSSFAEAENDFKEAYVRNNKIESLQHYLWILLMQGKQQLFEAEAISFGMTNEKIEDTRQRYEEAAILDSEVPEDEQIIEQYKKQLRTAFLC